ncbi:oxidoreductase [Verticiella sediminum]|uniref:Oxidoreductase n=1 Tax=Verticiella sediminum TaxID=1247510 RepID=A0A556AW43_9BURK|nr:PDR/VanB family oxidoreductase [Verticiella sediminum]TSH97146.1 oxidoreductase [Verticiella sediminum]
MTQETLKVRVRRRTLDAHDVVLLEMEPCDGGMLPRFEAGAHVDVHLADGLVRQYSLCGDPADTACYRLGVLRDPVSRGGSARVHELCEGVELQISAPRNHFPLAAGARRSLLYGGGIGVTPMIAMAYALHAAGADFELHYCGRSRSRCAFLDELARAPFAARVHTHFDDEPAAQRLDLAASLGAPDAGTHVYVCGPTGYMDHVIAGARAAGYADAQVHREYFQMEVDTTGDSFEVVAAASGKAVTVAGDESIVQALVRIGIDIPVSCEQGVCGTCLCTVLEGEPEHRDVYLTDEERADNDQILVCCSRARSARLVLDI